MSRDSSTDVHQRPTSPKAQYGQSTDEVRQSSNSYPGFDSISPYGAQSSYEINLRRIYEREFWGGAYVSAHLEKVQQGVYKCQHQAGDEKQIPDRLNVVLVAVRFVFHPSHALLHRIKSAVISITVSTGGNGPQPKILRYAPHLAYGRVSSADLKWQFQLGMSLGPALPAQATLNPQGSVEKDVVLHSMMTIQGSTRTARKAETLAEVDIEDGKLVWSLEENHEQKSGIPREFTFVLLLQQPSADGQRIEMSVDIKPCISWSLHLNKKPQRCVLDREMGQAFVAARPGVGNGKSVIAPSKSHFASMDDLDDLIELPGTICKS